MASYTDSPEETRGRRELTVAGIFFFLSLIVLYLPEGLQGQVAAGFRATLLRPFLFTQEMVLRLQHRAQDAQRLQASLDSLAEIVVTQAPLVEENRRLHELLELQQREPRHFLPATVIRPGTPGSESMFLLDVGTERGVAPGNPVIMRDGRVGLVGVVQQVSRGSAIGLDWSHPDFRASAMTSDGRVFGIVKPDRGLFREEDRLLLDGTPYYETLLPGTLITTSGLGGIYPRGIPIGTVEEKRDQELGWRTSYLLRPVVETGTITHALVVLGDEVPADLMDLYLQPGGIPVDSVLEGERRPDGISGGGSP